MKDFRLLAFFTQLGLSVVIPLAGFVLLGVWLGRSCGWGVWAIVLCALLGLYFAFQGLRSTLKTMEGMAKEDDKPMPKAFNEHD